MKKVPLAPVLALLVLLSCGATAPSTLAKGLEMSARNGVTTTGSPYRYVTLTTHTAPELTVVARTDRRDGQVDRWWQLGGRYGIPAVAYDGTGGGLSADGKTLVISHFAFGEPAVYPPKTTRLAVLDTDLRPQRHLKAGQKRPPSVFSSIELRGHYAFDAISPDGSTVYLIHYLDGAGRSGFAHYEVRAYDLKSKRLLPEPIVDPDERGERMEGLPLARATSPDGRWAYTLYDGNQEKPFIHALDTVTGRAVCVDLPQLATLPRRFYYLLHLQLRGGGRQIVLLQQRPGPKPTRSLLTVDTRSFEVRSAPVATASSGIDPWPPIVALSAAALLLLGWASRRRGLANGDGPVVKK